MTAMQRCPLSLTIDRDETTCWVTVVVNVVKRNVDPGERGGDWIFDFVFECAQEAGVAFVAVGVDGDSLDELLDRLVVGVRRHRRDC